MITQGGFYIGDFNGFGIVVSEKKYEIEDRWSESYFNTRTSDNDGHLNTIMMNSKNDSPIAKYVMSLNIDGYDDWYIPSRNEFHFILKNQNNLPKEYKFQFQWYWSSTQVSEHTSNVMMPIGNNFISRNSKHIENYIRTIRRFPLN